MNKKSALQKTIDTYQRRLQILKKQQAFRGFDVSLTMQIENIEQEIATLKGESTKIQSEASPKSNKELTSHKVIDTYQQRLDKLKKQLAMRGFDVSLTMEIANIEKEIATLKGESTEIQSEASPKSNKELTLQKVIDTYQQRLYKLKEQQAIKGYTITLTLEIQNVEQEIAKLKKELAELQSEASPKNNHNAI